MKLLLDAGNSALKWAVLDDHQIIQRGHEHYQASAPSAWSRLGKIDDIALSSVTAAHNSARVLQWCRDSWPQRPPRTIRSQAAACGVINAYPQPDSLGSDRWAALIGANRYCGGNKCIVDAGTAITIDLLQADGQHLGGFIAPGNQTMTSALQTNTTLSRPTAATNPPLTPGQTTSDCISSGITAALIGLITTVHAGFAGGDSTLILTGGGATALLPWLPDDTHHQPDLVFHGLTRILEHSA